IAIEDQLVLGESNKPGSYNHSQMVLVDTLAVYNLLGTLDPDISIETYNGIFHASANEMYKSLERIIDGIEILLGIDDVPLAVGNNNREALYQAIYAISDLIDTEELAGTVSVHSSGYITPAMAVADFFAFLSLYYLSPIYLSGGGISEGVMLDNHAVLYTEWLDGKYDGRYMEDRANALSALLGTNSTDNDNDNPEVD